MAGIDDFENGMSEEELEKLDQDGASANPENGTGEEETPTVPPTEEKTHEEEDEGSDPKKTPKEFEGPFHKHPRWIAREKKLKEYEERDHAREAELAELRSWREEVNSKLENARGEQDREEEVTIPDWFVTLYGEDEEAYIKYLEAEEAREAEIEERVAQRIEQRELQAREKQDADIQWVDDQLSSLREALEEEGLEEFEGLSEDELREFHNGVLRIVRDYTPTNEDGDIDFRKAYDILQKEKAADAAQQPKPKNSVSDRKRLAGRAPSAGEPNTEEIASNETFEQGDRPW